jgi:recombinational DNA repair ATPase RecF
MQLTLHNYRCFDSIKLNIPKGNFIIKDQNGTGKTSILTAIYAIETGLAWPATKFANYLQIHKQYFGISTKDSEWFLNGKVTPSGRVSTKYSNPNPTKLTYLTYQPNDNLWLFQSRSNKLTTLDQIISQTNQTHPKITQSLDKVCKNKLSLIKHYNLSGDRDTKILDFLNSQILELSMAIWQNRYNFFLAIQKSLPEYFDLTLTTPQNWQIEWEIADIDAKKRTIKSIFSKPEDLKSVLDSKINLSNIDFQRLFQKELITEKILFGAQRDDFSISCNGLRLEQTLSRGEMRLLILFIKKLGAKNSDTVWLLDDIFNELDDQREQFMLDTIFQGANQIIATGTRCNLANLKSFEVGGIMV